MSRLIGPRIMLREYRDDDFDSIRKWVNDPDTTRFLSSAFWRAQTEEDTREFLSGKLHTSHNSYNFVIADVQDEHYIGQVDLFRIDWRLRTGELGMTIAEESDRGHGLGREALLLMEQLVFRTLGLERLELEVHMENERALRCYRAAGFTLEGVKRHAYWSDGRFCDVGIMSILREEYEASVHQSKP